MIGVEVRPKLNLGHLCSSPCTPTSRLPTPQPMWPELIFKASFWILKREKGHCSEMLTAKVPMTHLKGSAPVSGSRKPFLRGMPAGDTSKWTGTGAVWNLGNTVSLDLFQW